MSGERKFCPALWFSGFFGLGALVHILRLVLGVSLIVGGWEVPTAVSGVVALVFGSLSVFLLYVGCSRPCCEKGGGREQ